MTQIFLGRTREAAKFLLVVYVAHYLARRQDDVRASFMGMVRPLGWLLIPAMLLLAEPDLGATVVIFVASAGVILLAGARLRDMGVLVLMGAGALAFAVYTSPYRMARLNAFLDPWAVQYGDGYQLTQALIAFGRGEWFGVGLGEGFAVGDIVGSPGLDAGVGGGVGGGVGAGGKGSAQKL